MVQSLSLSRRLSYFISNTNSRRGFSTKISEEAKVMKGEELKTTDKKAAKTNVVEKPSWIPDPKTGYYIPDTGLVKLRSVNGVE
ncbi:hypothetical protein N665_0012s0240 [Sinapis alba]|nr:hypothetical protein N665_0012s0240 [Sinapis alba]